MIRARVSIALATCDGARFVERQLESFAEQTRLPDELVVCDDDSTDRTRELVSEFARRAPFAVSLHPNQTRLGTTGNFEATVARSTGDVVLMADQDDVWLPAKIATLAGVLEAEPDVGAVFCNAHVVDESLSPLGYRLWDALGFGPLEQARVRAGDAVRVFLKHVVAAGTTLAFRGSFRDLVLPFPKLQSSHDAWTAFLIAAVSRVRIVDDPLVLYRLHADNQIGIRKLGLRGQLEKAREQLERRAFDHSSEFFTGARKRLADAEDVFGPVSAATRAGIDAKIEHARLRAGMSDRLWRRAPVVLGEALTGRYGRYSYGWKSVAQDLLLR